MQRKLLTLLVVAMVVLSGCSALTDLLSDSDGATADITETVTFPAGGVAGDTTVVTVTVSNDGDAEAQYNATLTVDGESVSTASTTLEGGASATLTLNHTFDETGEHTLSVANSSETIRVYETPFAFASAVNDNVETVRFEEAVTIDGTFVSDGERQAYHENSTATTSRNYTAETEYTDEVRNISLAGRSNRITGEEWVVNGTRYTREVDSGQTTYQREPSDTFDDDETELADEELRPYRRTERTDDEYVFILEADNSTAATDLWNTFSDDNESTPFGNLQHIYVEYRVDRQTGLQTERVLRLRGQGGETFSYINMALTRTYAAYGDPVTVTVPASVRAQATRDGTTVDTGTSASLERAAN